MENQDKLFNQIKAAADNAESPNFASMDKVWNRVEEKLDTKNLKKESNLWKKIAVAASVLLVATLGYQFFKNDNPKIQTNEIITQKDSVTVNPKSNALVVTDSINPSIKKNADLLLQKQIGTYNLNQVVAEESFKTNPYKISADTDNDTLAKASYSFSTTAGKKAATWEGDDKAVEKSKDVEVFVNKENKATNAHKEAPIVVINNQMSNLQTINKMDAAEIDSLVILKEPLYIINGIYYTEKEVFGPNPTSPYSPLNKQDIESVEVLQDEKAVELYGEKGKKGVVIISTKDGKPAVKNK